MDPYLHVSGQIKGEGRDKLVQPAQRVAAVPLKDCVRESSK